MFVLNFKGLSQVASHRGEGWGGIRVFRETTGSGNVIRDKYQILRNFWVINARLVQNEPLINKIC